MKKNCMLIALIIAVFALAYLAMYWNGSIGKMNITAGVKLTRQDEYVQKVTARPGDILRVEVIVQNLSKRRYNDLGFRAIIPDGLTFVEGSTMLYHQTNPDGWTIPDVSHWRNISSYTKGLGQSIITYEVQVNEIGNESILNIWNVVGRIDFEGSFSDLYRFDVTVEPKLPEIIACLAD
jgi:uncharacterized repeat protein (TIGR01451 family)